MYKRVFLLLSALLWVGLSPQFVSGQSASKASGGKNQGTLLTNEDISKLEPSGDVTLVPGQKAPAAGQSAGGTLTDADIAKMNPSEQVSVSGGMKPAAAASSKEMTLGDTDLPGSTRPEEIIAAVRAFHADLRDGNTTSALTRFSGISGGPAKNQALAQKLKKWGDAIAHGTTDFFVADAKIDGPAAVAFVDQIKIPYDPKDLTVDPWYLVKEGDAWKLLPKLTSYEGSKADVQGRFKVLADQFNQEKAVIGRDTYVAVPYAEESAQKVQNERREMWAYGKQPMAPPPLPLVPGLPAPE